MGRRISFIDKPGTRYTPKLSREKRSELRSVERTSSPLVALLDLSWSAYGNEEEELPTKSRKPGQKPNASPGIAPLACRQTVNSQYFLSAETRLRQMGERCRKSARCVRRAGCDLKARVAQSSGMTAAVEPSRQLRTESCVLSGNGYCQAWTGRPYAGTPVSGKIARTRNMVEARCDAKLLTHVITRERVW